MYYANQGSYKKEPDWQSKADARLEKWLKDKKAEERLKAKEAKHEVHVDKGVRLRKQQ